MIGVGARLAPWIFRWRRWLTGIVVLGAVVAAPSADFATLDNDMTAWFSKQDPVYVEYERFRQEFGGTRNADHRPRGRRHLLAGRTRADSGCDP